MCNTRQNLLNELNEITNELVSILEKLDKPTGHQPAIHKKLMRIIGYDTRVSEGLNELINFRDEHISNIIDRVKVCIATLNYLKEDEKIKFYDN